MPFFSLSGSDFVEMFVGVGAARVRDLFAAAKAQGAVHHLHRRAGRGRQAARRAGLRRRAATTSARTRSTSCWSRWTASTPAQGVVLIGRHQPARGARPGAAPARPLRPRDPGRPARPRRAGCAILAVHARKLTLGADVDLRRHRRRRPPASSAPTSPTSATRRRSSPRAAGATRCTMADFQDAFERVIGGLEKKGKVLNARERRIVAYHESGHTLVGYFTPGADPVQKVSIVPRGRGALGYTLQAPLEDRYLMSERRAARPHSHPARRARRRGGGVRRDLHRRRPTISRRRAASCARC